MEVPNDKESEGALDETLKQVKETLDAVGKCSTPANNKGDSHSTPANITGDSHLITERMSLREKNCLLSYDTDFKRCLI